MGMLYTKPSIRFMVASERVQDLNCDDVEINLVISIMLTLKLQDVDNEIEQVGYGVFQLTFIRVT